MGPSYSHARKYCLCACAICSCGLLTAIPTLDAWQEVPCLDADELEQGFALLTVLLVSSPERASLRDDAS